MVVLHLDGWIEVVLDLQPSIGVSLRACVEPRPASATADASGSQEEGSSDAKSSGARRVVEGHKRFGGVRAGVRCLQRDRVT